MDKSDAKDAAQRKRAELVRDLDLRGTYQRDHSPTGVMRRRVRHNPDTGEYEVLPEPIPSEKPKVKPGDKSLENLRKKPK